MRRLLRTVERAPRTWGLLALALAFLLPVPAGAQDASDLSASLEALDPGHQRMRMRLAEIARNTPTENPFLGTRTEQAMTQLLRKLRREKNNADPFSMWKLLYDLGRRALHRDDIDRARNLLTRAKNWSDRVDFPAAIRAGRIPPREDPKVYYENILELYIGVTELRRGELENCCARNTGESCILPFQGTGLHTRQEGSRAAMKHFLAILENRPSRPDPMERRKIELTAKWLLNLAAMTIGEYPDSVPEKHRVTLREDEGPEDFPRFRNIGPDLEMDTENLSGGVITEDFDNDGFVDVLTSTWDTADEMRFFRNDGKGGFVNQTNEVGLGGFYGGLNMVQADYDNDGFTDAFVLRGAWLRKAGQHPNSLLKNVGGQVFRDVSFAAGLAKVDYPTKTGAWGDYDLDGDLDLYIGNESTADVEAPSQLFENQGDGTFVDVAPKLGLAEKIFAMGSSWGDYDADGDPDLYVSTGYTSLQSEGNEGSANKLYRNDRDRFVDVAPKLGVTAPIAGFPCWFWDVENDGDLDIYASCSSGPVGVLVSDDLRFGLNRLYINDGKGGFEEASERYGLDYPAQPMGANFGDLDNDGFLDFYLSTGNIHYHELRPNVMFLNGGGRSFANVTMKGGFGHLQKGHGVAFFDYDNDGDNDVYAQMGGALPGDKFLDALFRNPGFGNRWVALDLEGTRSNRSAIGARIAIEIEEEGRTRTVYRHVNSGGSFGCSPLLQTIGLGGAETIVGVTIDWPSGGTTKLETLELDRRHHIVEGR